MKTLLLFLLTGALMMSCTDQQTNPLLSEFKTPFGTPPFDQIKDAHFEPAFLAAMKINLDEIDAIVNNTAHPTFNNTIEALEHSGKKLKRINRIFGLLNGAETNDALQAVAKTITPLMSKHRDRISLNEDLFARIKTIYVTKETADLNAEQLQVLQKYFDAFVRGGANLAPEKKIRFSQINEELSSLSLQFGENVLKETNRFEMIIDNREDLAGLPDNVITTAAETAKRKGHDGKWVFTIQKSSLIPFIQYSEKRELREKLFKGYIECANHGDELDNKNILTRMAALRVEKANLLGYATHAHFILDENMAKKPENVYKLLHQLWEPANKKAKEEARKLQTLIKKEGHSFKLQPWDWWYYTEKLKKVKYDLDEEMLRPYFQVDKVREGAFNVATKLWGLTFHERTDIPVYHEEVKVFEVKDKDGSHLAILFTDYHPRPGKRGGAWMDVLREQHVENGQDIRPIIYNVGNFTRPTNNQPALISVDEALTLFHEFGHALHGMLSKTTYETVAGTNVARDFVELPSQIMENWATHPEVLKTYALHYKTGEAMPDELIEKIKNSRHFNQGFATTEYLAASFLDMDWHTLTKAEELDAMAFENKSMTKIGLIPEIVVRYRSPYFRHIFAGGYASGYYGYVWAEVLDKDAFQAFAENGIFDQKTSQSFRDHILSKGSTKDPMALYKAFRGKEPEVNAYLESKGLN